MTDHQKALDKAKILLMSSPDSAFFTSVCFSMKHRWDDGIATACTNGIEIRYNTQFFMGLDAEERLFLLLHETLHVALMHVTRLNGRDPRKWNIAADYVINYMLVQKGFKLPKGGLYDEQYAGMTADEVYDLLPDNPTEDLPMEDIEEPGEGTSTEEVQSQLDDILIRATLQSQMAEQEAGTIPAEVQLYVNGLLNPKLPWHAILRRFITKIAKTDYTWRRPNRRYFPDHYLPTRYSNSLCNISVFMDISVSVQDHQFHQFVSETYSVLKQQKPDSMTLGLFDTEIKSTHTIKSPQDLMNVTFKGRGGTDIHPVFEWAEKNVPNVLIVFTDGHFRHELPKPNFPVIWVINDNPNYQAPWGKVIHFDTTTT